MKYTVPEPKNKYYWIELPDGLLRRCTVAWISWLFDKCLVENYAARIIEYQKEPTIWHWIANQPKLYKKCFPPHRLRLAVHNRDAK